MYGDDLLGDEIARNWLKTVNQFYLEQHKLIEKYHIADGVPREGGGGEYPLQDGFGWTNGVVRRLIGFVRRTIIFYNQPLTSCWL